MSRPEVFEPGRHYVIVEAFDDFDRRKRRVGDVMRFESRDLAIYDGGTTLHFTDPEGGGFVIRLQDVEQEDVLHRLDRIFRAATAPERPAGPLRSDAELLAAARVGATESTWPTERTIALAWVVGLLPRLRGLSEDQTSRVCESLRLDAPALETRSQPEVEAELAWCEALIEFRATGVEVWPSQGDAALAEHRAALRWALGT